MAQQLNSINLVAPAFKGINTEDSPLAQDPSFAEIADNAVIDKRGRIAARKGHNVITTNKTVLGTDSIRAIKEFRDDVGNNKIFSVGNNKIISGTTTLVDETPGSYTINDDNWKMVNFNDKIYFFQRSVEPLVYDNAGGSVVTLSSVSGAAGVTSAMYGNEVLAAYGRLWTCGIGSNQSTIYWSDLLIGHDWSGGTSGSIDISKVWPDGRDEIVALAAHNSALIIFGKHSIVVYEGAEAPATMALADTVAGVGCVDRDTVQYTGSDVLFLSHTGLKSFGRTIQEKSMPMRDISNNVRSELTKIVKEQTNPIKSIYSAEQAIYLLSFADSQTVYCFDMRQTLQDGTNRVTTWSGVNPRSMARLSDGSIYFGRENGIFEYEGYLDDGEPYQMLYYSNPLNFGNSTNIKFLKKFNITVIGNVAAKKTLAWAYDYGSTFNKKVFSTEEPNKQIAEYNVAEFVDATTTLQIPDQPTVFLGDYSSAPATTGTPYTFYFNTTDSKFYFEFNNTWIEATVLNLL